MWSYTLQLGAGKTYVFEQLIDSGWKGKAVYTVPTRALANDKFREWKERGWEVGLVTGDLALSFRCQNNSGNPRDAEKCSRLGERTRFICSG